MTGVRRDWTVEAWVAGGLALAALVLHLPGCRGGAAAPEQQGAEAPARALGPMAPALDLLDLGGARVGLSEYRGRPLIINFWATWCQPCRREMPSLVRLHETMAGGGLEILAVSIDADRAAVERYLRETPLPLRVLLDPGKAAAERYGVVTVPSSFVLDPEGRVVERIDGEADWTSPELLATLARLVRERPRAAGDDASGDAT
jgi:peroxiredoxin